MDCTHTGSVDIGKSRHKTLDSQYDILVSVIEKSGALRNAFFDRCKSDGLSEAGLQSYLINWYPITDTI